MIKRNLIYESGLTDVYNFTKLNDFIMGVELH